MSRDPDADLRARLDTLFDSSEAEPVPPQLHDPTLAALRVRRGHILRTRLIGSGVLAATATGLAAVLVGAVLTHHQPPPGPATSPTARVPVVTGSASPATSGSPLVSPTPTATTSASPSAPSGVTPVPPTSTPGSGALFSDDFAADTVGGAADDGWTVDSGTWKVATVGATHTAHSTSAAEARLSVGDNSWTDITVSARVRFGAGAKLGGVAVHYHDAGTYDFCKYLGSTGHLIIGKGSGGTFTILQSTPFTPAAGTDYTFSLTAKGSALSCTVDGGSLLQGSDPALTSGRIALIGGGPVDVTAVTVNRS